MTNEISIYNYHDYRDYLNHYIQARRILERGIQAKLAESIGCQAAYVSKVLAGDAHFNLEQAERTAVFCNHTRDEKHFFLLLTQQTRAGTPSLKKYFGDQIEELKNRNKSLKEHINLDNVSDLETQLLYYGHWSIAAIHVLLTIPKYRTRVSIAEKLNMSASDVNRTLDFLKSKHLVEEHGGTLGVGKVGLHLGADSPVIRQHHNNWRLKALDSIARGDINDLHYSSVVSISESDRERFRSDLIKWIVEFRNSVEASKEENLISIGIDFFAV